MPLGWFPTFGGGEGFFGHIEHLTLPAVALALVVDGARRPRHAHRGARGGATASTSRPRSAAASRSRSIVRRHVLRNAAIPITTVAGITIASLIALAAVVERAFSLNGLGAYLVAGRRVEGLRRGAGHLARARDGVRRRQHRRRRAVRGARPARQAAERGPNERRRHRRPPRTPPARRAASRTRPARHRRGRPRLRRRDRARRADRHLRAVAHAARPRRRSTSRTPSSARRATTARPRQPGPRHRSRASWPAPGRRCSGPLIVVALAMRRGHRARRSPPRGAAASFDSTIVVGGLDVLFAFPGILLAVLAAAVFGAGLTTAALALAVAYTPYVARVLRSAALRERSAAVHRRARGAGPARRRRICVRHLAPQRAAADRRPGARSCSATRWSTSRRSRSSASACSRRSTDWGVMVSGGQAGVLQGYADGGARRRASASSSSWSPSTCSANDSPTEPRSNDDRTALPVRDRGAARVPRAATLSPVELMEAVIDRADKVDGPTVNAFASPLRRARRSSRPKAAEARYMGNGEPPRPLEGIPMAVKEEEAGRRRAVDAGLADLRARDRRAQLAVRRADPRRRGDHPRPDHGARVLVRRLHPLAAVGCDPQPVEPRVRGRRLLRRIRRGARRRHGDARQRLRHRRLDPHPGQLQRRRRLQAAVRSRARGRRRSTTTSSATSARWRAPSPTAPCSQNVVSGAHPRDHVSVRHRVELPERFEPIDGLRSPERRPRRLAGRPGGRRQHAADRGEALRSAGAIVDEVDLARAPARRRCARSSIHFNLIFAAMVDAEVDAHGDLMCDYALDFARDGAAGRRRRPARRVQPAGQDLRAGRRAARAVRRAACARRSPPAVSSPATRTSATGSRSAGSSSSTTSTRS